MTEAEARAAIVAHGASLFARGFSVGSAGNVSVRVDGGYLITPTNSSLGRLDGARLSLLDASFRHVAGDPPSKEVPMHRAFYAARPAAGAVVHLHSTWATAVACLAAPGDSAPIAPLTPYFVMRIGRDLPVLPYVRPGDPAMEAAIEGAARTAVAVLLANHGPVVSAESLDAAVNAAEELEEAAKLHMLLHGMQPRRLTPTQVEALL